MRIKKSHKKYNFVSLIVLLILIAGGGLAFWYYNQNSEKIAWNNTIIKQSEKFPTIGFDTERLENIAKIIKENAAKKQKKQEPAPRRKQRIKVAGKL